MPRTLILRFLVAMLLLLIGLSQLPLLSYAEPSSNLESVMQESLESQIEQYIRNHPHVILQSLQALEDKRKEETKQRARRILATRQNDLINDATSPVSGNLNGDMVLIEFFDYRCGFCKQAAPAVTQLQKEDSRVRVVYKNLPILGEPSELAARAALASRAQGRHQLFHETLLATSEDLTRERIFQIANDIGLDIKRLQTDMDSPEWQDVIERNRELAKDLGINGTPGFIVGTEVSLGALDLKGLKELLKRGILPQKD